MPERTISIRYDGERGLEWHEQWFRDLADRRGLAAVSSDVTSQSLCTPAHLAEAPKMIWGGEDLERLRAEGKLELSAEKTEALCRPITIHSQIFANEDGTTRLTVRAAERNEYPCLGYWTWIEDDLRLPGGFVDIEGPSQAEADAIAEEILAATPRAGD